MTHSEEPSLRPEASASKNRTLLAGSIIGNLVLIAALGGFWWKSHRAAPAPTAPVTATPETGAMSTPSPTSQNSMPDGALNGENGTVPSPTPLAPVQLTPERLQSIGVTFAPVVYKNLQEEMRVTGSVAVDEQRISTVAPRFNGWIQKTYVDAAYQYVHRGQPLFTIYSPDLVATEQEYLLARQNRERLAHSSVPGVAADAASLVHAAAQRLEQWNVPPAQIAALEKTGKIQRTVTIESPASGYVTVRNALPNLYVQPQTELYRIADLSTVWVNAQVFQNDLSLIRAGAPAEVTIDTFPGRIFHGRVDFIYPNIDPATRTANVRLVMANPGLKLKPGMFVNVDLKSSAGRQLAVPASAILQSGTRQIAFVREGGGVLQPRPVVTGAQVGDEIPVLQGLKAGEQVVASANFLIDSESQLQAAAGAFTPPPPGAGQSAAMNGTAARPTAVIALSTQPSPPQKGRNSFQVKLTSAAGPISDAQVTVTFFMPAMPAMGMSAMRMQTTLIGQGGGVYSGEGVLGSGGTWQVTVTAQRNGAVLASKHFSIDATGGM